MSALCLAAVLRLRRFLALPPPSLPTYPDPSLRSFLRILSLSICALAYVDVLCAGGPAMSHSRRGTGGVTPPVASSGKQGSRRHAGHGAGGDSSPSGSGNNCTTGCVFGGPYACLTNLCTL